MTEQISPEEAAQIAEPDTGVPELPEGTEAHMGAEGIDASGSSVSSEMFSSLWNTRPNPALEAVESPWDTENGGLSRVYRGVQKMADVDGMPAIVDVLVGMAEFWTQQQGPNSDDNTEEIETVGTEVPVDGVPREDEE